MKCSRVLCFCNPNVSTDIKDNTLLTTCPMNMSFIYFTTDTTLPRIPVATGILASLRISLHKIQKTSAFHLIPSITKITDCVFMEEDSFLMQNIWGFSGTLKTRPSGNGISLELTLTRRKLDLGSTWVSIVLFLQSGSMVEEVGSALWPAGTFLIQTLLCNWQRGQFWFSCLPGDQRPLSDLTALWKYRLLRLVV